MSIVCLSECSVGIRSLLRFASSARIRTVEWVTFARSRIVTKPQLREILSDEVHTKRHPASVNLFLADELGCNLLSNFSKMEGELLYIAC